MQICAPDQDLKNYYSGRAVLVTGAAGSIGSHLTRRLRARGASLTLVDNLSQGFRWLLDSESAKELIEGDISDEHIVRDLFRLEPATVFHMAALFANQNSVDHPKLDLMSNGMGTLNILSEIARTGKARLVFASTSSVLGNYSDGPLRDDAPAVGFGSPYQITKGLGEQYCRYYAQHYGVDVVRVRLFNSYGPGEVPGRYRNVIPNFFWLARHQRPLPIYGTGLETRDWTYVDDIVTGLLRAGASTGVAGTAICLGTGVESRVIDVAEEINRLTGNPAGVTYVSRRNWDGVLRRLSSPALAANLFGYEASVSLVEGLAKTASWFNEQGTLIFRSQTFELCGT